MNNNLIQFTIKTAYSIESYVCIYDNDVNNSVYDFLSDICFCDEWVLIDYDEADNTQYNKYNEAIEASFNSLDALLYASNYYESLNEIWR